MMENVQIKEQREYAWNYFQFHASQRMSTFNFFVVFCALLTAGLAGTIGRNSHNHLLGVLLGVSLMTVSFVFWKLDQRVRFLIKHAEAALKKIERAWKESPDKVESDCLLLFCSEERKTTEMLLQANVLPSKWKMSYSQCFAVMYLMFSILGLMGIVMSVC